MLPEAKLLCNRAPRRVEFHSVRWMAAVDKFTPLKLAPLPDQSTDPGGTWTCLNPIWYNWYDLTLVNRVAVSNILRVEFYSKILNLLLTFDLTNDCIYIYIYSYIYSHLHQLFNEKNKFRDTNFILFNFIYQNHNLQIHQKYNKYQIKIFG